MKIKTIITDDESGAREVLKTLIEEFFNELEIVAICENLPEAIKAIKKHQPHVVFMDIEMPGYSGLELYDFLNEDERTFQLIFATAFNEFAVHAFRLAAIDYLLKPIQFQHLKDAVDRIKSDIQLKTSLEQLSVLKNNLNETHDKKMCISTTEGKYYIPFNDIMFMEADGSYTTIFINQKKEIHASRRLKYYEEMLEGDNRFVRIHRSTVVNVTYIEKIKKGNESKVVLKNGIELDSIPEKLKNIL
ncbi:MAG: LytTR family DNA-binding domain-containing protein [Bacteroidia bacterium]|nr:LytTR family DNA-binding domain-containing protein [Bacteroidia bacterium]